MIFVTILPETCAHSILRGFFPHATGSYSLASTTLVLLMTQRFFLFRLWDAQSLLVVSGKVSFCSLSTTPVSEWCSSAHLEC